MLCIDKGQWICQEQVKLLVLSRSDSLQGTISDFSQETREKLKNLSLDRRWSGQDLHRVSQNTSHYQYRLRHFVRSWFYKCKLIIVNQPTYRTTNQPITDQTNNQQTNQPTTNQATDRPTGQATDERPTD